MAERTVTFSRRHFLELSLGAAAMVFFGTPLPANSDDASSLLHIEGRRNLGMRFHISEAEFLKEDPWSTYTGMIQELKPDILRLSLRLRDDQPSALRDLGRQIKQAKDSLPNVQILLTVGLKPTGYPDYQLPPGESVHAANFPYNSWGALEKSLDGLAGQDYFPEINVFEIDEPLADFNDPDNPPEPVLFVREQVHDLIDERKEDHQKTLVNDFLFNPNAEQSFREITQIVKPDLRAWDVYIQAGGPFKKRKPADALTRANSFLPEYPEGLVIDDVWLTELQTIPWVYGRFSPIPDGNPLYMFPEKFDAYTPADLRGLYLTMAQRFRNLISYDATYAFIIAKRGINKGFWFGLRDIRQVLGSKSSSLSISSPAA